MHPPLSNQSGRAAKRTKETKQVSNGSNDKGSSINAHTLSVTRNNLHSVGLCELHHFPELHIVQHQCPDVVAEPVRAQFGRLEGDPALHAVREGCIDGLVEL